MELDFTGLENIAHISPQDERISIGPEVPKQHENHSQGLKEGVEGIRKLQWEADRQNQEIERNLEVYGTYQNNIKVSGTLQAEILKGARNGESIYSLFLKAAKAISLMTSNSTFYSQLQADITAIYGAGLLEAIPLEMELTAVQERLQRLREAETREPQKASIQAAIKAHEQRAEQLQALLQRNERESPTA
ncbi:MAG: hypothetical protein EOM87_07955 [Clostridia bacterium]|nr:hypothetical protein [Clostridia bacterium]